MQNHCHRNPVPLEIMSMYCQYLEGNIAAAWILFSHKVFLCEGRPTSLYQTQDCQGEWWMKKVQDFDIGGQVLTLQGEGKFRQQKQLGKGLWLCLNVKSHTELHNGTQNHMGDITETRSCLTCFT